MSTVRRNPLQSLISATQQTLTAATSTVQKAATQVGKNVQGAATQVQKTASQVSTAVSNTTRQVGRATTNAVKHVRAETQKATEESGFNTWNSKFEAKDGKVEIGVTKGTGSKMDEAATLKTVKSRHFEDEPEARKLGEKARVAGKEVLDSVGINVFDPETSKFEKDWDATSIKTRRVDAKTVDAQGYEVGYRALAAYADGTGQVRIGKATNVEGKIEAGAVLGQGTFEGKTTLGAVDLTGKAEATVGATASASGQLRVDLFSARPAVKVKAGVDAFVGVKASAEGRVGNDLAGVGAKGEVIAGLALKARADVGIENGRFKAKVELGAALGIGGSVSVNVDVNYQKAIDTVVGTGKKAVETLTNAASTAGKGLSYVASAVGSGISNAASSGWKTVSSWF